MIEDVRKGVVSNVVSLRPLPILLLAIASLALNSRTMLEIFATTYPNTVADNTYIITTSQGREGGRCQRGIDAKEIWKFIREG